MKNTEFYRWVQGYLELCPDDDFTLHKMYIVRNHLNLVYAVEGRLGEYNSELLRITDQVISEPEENLKAKRLRDVYDFIKQRYIEP